MAPGTESLRPLAEQTSRNLEIMEVHGKLLSFKESLQGALTGRCRALIDMCSPGDKMGNVKIFTQENLNFEIENVPAYMMDYDTNGATILDILYGARREDLAEYFEVEADIVKSYLESSPLKKHHEPNGNCTFYHNKMLSEMGKEGNESMAYDGVYVYFKLLCDDFPDSSGNLFSAMRAIQETEMENVDGLKTNYS